MYTAYKLNIPIYKQKENDKVVERQTNTHNQGCTHTFILTVTNTHTSNTQTHIMHTNAQTPTDTQK